MTAAPHREQTVTNVQGNRRILSMVNGEEDFSTHPVIHDVTPFPVITPPNMLLLPLSGWRQTTVS